MTRIKDKFSELPVSRQRKYQLRKLQEKRCIICGETAVSATYCLLHVIKYRERHRAKQNFQRRHLGARSYQLERAEDLVAA